MGTHRQHKKKSILCANRDNVIRCSLARIIAFTCCSSTRNAAHFRALAQEGGRRYAHREEERRHISNGAQVLLSIRTHKRKLLLLPSGQCFSSCSLQIVCISSPCRLRRGLNISSRCQHQSIHPANAALVMNSLGPLPL